MNHAQPSEPETYPALLQPRTQWALRLMCGAMMLFVMVRAGVPTLFGNRDTPTGDYPPLQIDLNEATHQELALMPRIGPTMADRIITDRAERGSFDSVEDLTRVRGIGDKTVEGLAPFVVVNP